MVPISIQFSFEKFKEIDRKLSRCNRKYIFRQKNADKTLKCPKCNWHYKYIETLEAHIREKHGDDPVNTGLGSHNVFMMIREYDRDFVSLMGNNMNDSQLIIMMNYFNH